VPLVASLCLPDWLAAAVLVEPAPASLALEEANGAIQARLLQNIDALAPGQGPAQLVTVAGSGGSPVADQGCLGVGDGWLQPGEVLQIHLDGAELAGRRGVGFDGRFVLLPGAVIRVEARTAAGIRVATAQVAADSAASVGTHPLGALFALKLSPSDVFQSLRITALEGKGAFCPGNSTNPSLVYLAHGSAVISSVRTGTKFSFRGLGNVQPWLASGVNFGVNAPPLLQVGAAQDTPGVAIPTFGPATGALGVQGSAGGAPQAGPLGAAIDGGEWLELAACPQIAASGRKLRWVLLSAKPQGGAATGSAEFWLGDTLVASTTFPTSVGAWHLVGAGGQLFDRVRFGAQAGSYALTGVRLVTELEQGPQCFGIADCGDSGDLCSPYVCASGTCKVSPKNCADGNACTADSCSAGTCKNTPIDCDDGNPCTLDVCLPNKGCRSERFDAGLITCGLGECKHTQPACKNGAPTTCDPLEGAAPELCDGLDNDCDGAFDEDWAGLNAPCTVGLGPCAAPGVVLCDAAGFTASCHGSPLEPPVALDKSCDGVDNDCDGSTDEDFNSKVSLCGQGACANNQGVVACVGGDVVDTCDPFSGASANDAVCNGIDDDCDGQIDEDFAPSATSCGTGACAAKGELLCVSGTLKDTCTAKSPGAVVDTVCNGIDDDCDGAVDEEYPAGKVSCGVGACKSVGTAACNAGVENVVCEPGQPFAATDTTCDEIDDNCNGTVDEGCPVPPGCDLGYEPCLIPPPAGPPDVGKPACKVATVAYCQFFASTIDNYGEFVQASTSIQVTPLSGGSTDPACYLYGAKSCLSCNYPTLQFCANPTWPFPSPCTDVAEAECPFVQAAQCPTVNLSKCSSATFYNNTPPFLMYDIACTPPVRDACDALFAHNCPSTQGLDACGPLLANLSAVTPACRGHVVRKCEPQIELLCPGKSIQLCSNIAAANVHPACTALVAERCADWQTDLCVPLFGMPVTANNCANDFGAFTGPAIPGPCKDWALAQCPAVIADTAQITWETGAASGGAAGCDNETVKEGTGYAYSVVDSVSDASQFDCQPPEAMPEPPHDQDFTLNVFEALFAAAPVAALNQSISGLSVESCDEYVKQKYYDYYRFKAFTEIFANDPRRVWQAGYSPRPEYRPYAIGHRARTATSNNAFGYFPSGTPALANPIALHGSTEGSLDIRNDYVRILFPRYSELYESLMDFESRAPQFSSPPFIEAKQQALDNLAEDIASVYQYWPKGGGYGPNSGWQHHHEISRRMRDEGVTDEELTLHYHRRQRFLEAAEEWRAIDAKRDALASIVVGPGSPYAIELIERLNELTAAKNAVVVEIEELLFQARDLGCFDPAFDSQGKPRPAVCDWAPQDWTDEVERAFQARIDLDRRTCVRYMPADFSLITGGYDYLQVINGQIVSTFTGVDPTASIALMEQYIARVKQTASLQGAFFAQIPPEQRPVYGQSWSDGDEVGDPSYFQVSWGYSAGWSLDVPPIEINICELEGAAHAELDCGVTILDEPFSILDAGVAADTATPYFESHLRVLGVEFWQEGGTQSAPLIPSLNYELNIVYDGNRIEKAEGDSVDVPVFSFAGIDILMRAGYAGQLGLESSGFLRAAANFNGENCSGGLDFGLGIEARPYASLSGFIEAGLDLFIVEFGVGGELTLLGLSLPVSVSVQAQADANLQATTADLVVDTEAKLDLSTLSGRLYFYAETFWKTYRSTFFRWDGYSWSTTLLSRAFDFNLGLAFDYCLSFDCFE
jgi:hypothetical protein